MTKPYMIIHGIGYDKTIHDYTWHRLWQNHTWLQLLNIWVWVSNSFSKIVQSNHFTYWFLSMRVIIVLYDDTTILEWLIYRPKHVSTCRNSADDMYPFCSLSNMRSPSTKSSYVAQSLFLLTVCSMGRKTSNEILASVKINFMVRFTHNNIKW
jgi:hypothetical protein